MTKVPVSQHRFLWLVLALLLVSVAAWSQGSPALKRLKGAETRKHFDGRLGYDIDEIIRAEEDPEYAATLEQRSQDTQDDSRAVAEHKRLRQSEIENAEQARLEFIRQRESQDLVGKWKLQKAGYREHLREQRQEAHNQEIARQEFVTSRGEEIQRRAQLRKQNIDRAIASQRK